MITLLCWMTYDSWQPINRGWLLYHYNAYANNFGEKRILKHALIHTLITEWFKIFLISYN